MFKMSIPVVLVSVRAAKDSKSNNYASFIFTGGSADLAIDSAAFGQLKDSEGLELVAVFQMRPVPMVRFGRSITVFEPIKFLGMDK